MKEQMHVQKNKYSLSAQNVNFDTGIYVASCDVITSLYSKYCFDEGAPISTTCQSKTPKGVSAQNKPQSACTEGESSLVQ